jgi:hypothetical protein
MNSEENRSPLYHNLDVRNMFDECMSDVCCQVPCAAGWTQRKGFENVTTTYILECQDDDPDAQSHDSLTPSTVPSTCPPLPLSTHPTNHKPHPRHTYPHLHLNVPRGRSNSLHMHLSCTPLYIPTVVATSPKKIPVITITQSTSLSRGGGPLVPVVPVSTTQPAK